MDYFKSKNLYQEIEPIPQRGRKKLLNYVLIGILTAAIVAIVVVVMIHTFESDADPEIPDPASYNDSDTEYDVLQASRPKYILGAPAPADDEDNFGGEADAEPSKIIAPSSTGSPVRSTTTARPITTTSGSAPAEDVIVEIEQGTLLGRRMISRAGREYLAFLGIPYAKPPLGELRFLPPVEAESWNGTLNATYFQPNCLQKDKYNPEIVTKGSEDCLYINVYTPKNLTTIRKRYDSQKFPVMVYHHGGGQFGSATRYGAEYFMDENVILVTFHYRLGILGNLNTNTSLARGNQGLKDQVMALQWVKDNIKKFGGNNRKVTIFGNSYGGMEVTCHMLSPMSKGLFHRTISQSGTEIVPLIFTLNPLNEAQVLGKKLNCSGNSSTDLVDCFRKTGGEKLILNSYLMSFQASIEPQIENDNEEPFFTDTPLNLLQNGALRRVPAMYGGVSGEGLFTSLPILSSPELTTIFDDNWNEVVGMALGLANLTTSQEDRDRIAQAARDFYLGSNDLGPKVERNFTAMFTDRNFLHPATVFATFQLETNRRDREGVYLYYFNEPVDKSYADPALGPYRNLTGTTEFLGNGHADELQFLFPYDSYPTIPLSSAHADFSKMMIRMWASFADTGKPTGADNGTEWLPIDQKPFKWFELKSSQPQMIDTLGDRMNFWDSFNLTDLYV